MPAGNRAGVGSEHQESHTEHAPDLPLRTGQRDRERGEDLINKTTIKKITLLHLSFIKVLPVWKLKFNISSS